MARASKKQSRSLKEYRRKRDFARTPEPKPRPAAKPGKRVQRGSSFVVQKHAARRVHFDLRLELDGVLKSWAVTRGPSLTLGEKRLAVRTEDHPMQYLDFEGNIPKGEYGGGAMIIWDHGRWHPEEDPHRGMEKGHLAFTLEGERLKGLWHLVRIKPRRGERTEPWLLMKADDTFARHPGDPEITDEETESPVSGKTIDQLAAEATLRADHDARAKVAKLRKVTLPDIGKVPGARKKLLPAFVEPSRAAPTEKPPSGPKWVHEIKYDGYRIQARIDGHAVKLLTRTGLDWTQRFRSIATALRKLKLGSALLDGEIVVEDESGLSRFPDLQAALEADQQDRFRYRIFDMLYCDGFDLTPASLIDRKNALEQVLDALPHDATIIFSDHLDADGPKIFEHAGRLGLEGIISKRRDLPYRSGRGEHWLKSKCVAQEELLIAGYVPSTVSKEIVGALPLAYRHGGKLYYAGRVGTGWSATEAKALREALEPSASAKPAFANPLPDGAEKGVRWVTPKLVGQIQFRGWSNDGMVRQASFKGLREDKSADEVILEQSPIRSKAAAAPRTVSIKLTHPDRLLWEDGVTKQALAEFYVEIADWILPHLVGRVLSLLRSPSGTNEKSFFAKHPWHGLDASVQRVAVDDTEMMVIRDIAGLISLVQAGVVEIHPWGSTYDRLEHPDRLTFDLDPGEDVAWTEMIEAASEVRARLGDLKLESFVKTTGGKGLHVVVPLVPGPDWDAAKAFTKSLAEAMAKDSPSRYIAITTKRARRGRVFVDYLRNGRGATAVAAYSTRARPHAPISTPIAWEELAAGIGPNRFTVDNLRQRLDFLKHDPWQDFFKIRQRLPAGKR